MLHPAVDEYLRWVMDTPLMFGSMKEMPMEIADGFDYLCRHFGKSLGEHLDKSAGSEQHEAAVENLKKLMNAMIPGQVT